LSLLLLSSCGNTRYLQKDEALVTNIKINIESDVPIPNRQALENALVAISKPKLNRKWLGIARTNLWFYNIGDPEKEGIPGWLSNKVGEPPALYDPYQHISSAARMERYLFNRGYYGSTVTEIIPKENDFSDKQITMIYDVKINSLFKIDSISYPKDSLNLTDIIQKNKKASYLKEGDAFNVENMQTERQRLTNILREHGYFDFNRNDIRYEIDSSATKSEVDLYLKVDPPEDDSLHRQYRIKEIFVNSEYYVSDGDSVQYDTLKLGDYHYISKNTKLFKSNSILEQINFDRGELYSLSDYRNTFNNLLELGVFKFVNIRFDKKVDSLGNYLLDTYILLTPSKRREYSVEAEINSRYTDIFFKGDLGTALNATYQNRNVWGGGERISYNLYGGVEFNLNDEERALINNISVSGEVNLTIPKFLNPIPKRFVGDKTQEILKSSKIKTRFSLVDNFIRLVGIYSVNATELSYGYNWKYGKQTRHFITPVSLAYSFIYDQDESFTDLLANDIRLQRSFEDRLIIGGSYSYLYSNLSTTRTNRHFNFRGDVEVVGNVMNGVESLLQSVGLLQNDFATLFGGLDYSQFVRLQADYRYHINIGKTALVSRVYGGIGVPYGNSGEYLPFIRQFYSGGSNGVRAFRIRGLGPGSYEPVLGDSLTVQNVQFERTGDLKLEANVEYRFPLFWYFKGALFMDAGNVWTLYETNKVGGQFKADSFLQQMGFGGGLGLRLDFSYFILRVDCAKPFYKPFLPLGERWTFTDFELSNKEWRQENLVLQFGIGYPF